MGGGYTDDEDDTLWVVVPVAELAPPNGVAPPLLLGGVAPDNVPSRVVGAAMEETLVWSDPVRLGPITHDQLRRLVADGLPRATYTIVSSHGGGAESITDTKAAGAADSDPVVRTVATTAPPPLPPSLPDGGPFPQPLWPLLSQLAAVRAAVRRQLAIESDAIVRARLDALQLALKVTLNGFCGHWELEVGPPLVLNVTGQSKAAAGGTRPRGESGHRADLLRVAPLQSIRQFRQPYLRIGVVGDRRVGEMHLLRAFSRLVEHHNGERLTGERADFLLLRRVTHRCDDTQLTHLLVEEQRSARQIEHLRRRWLSVAAPVPPNRRWLNRRAFRRMVRHYTASSAVMLNCDGSWSRGALLLELATGRLWDCRRLLAETPGVAREAVRLVDWQHTKEITMTMTDDCPPPSLTHDSIGTGRTTTADPSWWGDWLSTLQVTTQCALHRSGVKNPCDLKVWLGAGPQLVATLERWGAVSAADQTSVHAALGRVSAAAPP